MSSEAVSTEIFSFDCNDRREVLVCMDDLEMRQLRSPMSLRNFIGFSTDLTYQECSSTSHLDCEELYFTRTQLNPPGEAAKVSPGGPPGLINL
jgi:hypothetical protein